MSKFIPRNTKEFRDELTLLMLNPYVKFDIKIEILRDYLNEKSN